MPNFMIVLILYINILNLSWILKIFFFFFFFFFGGGGGGGGIWSL